MTASIHEVGPISLRRDNGVSKLFQIVGLNPEERPGSPGGIGKKTYAKLHGWEVEHCFSESFRATAPTKNPLPNGVATDLIKRYPHFFTFCDENEFQIRKNLLDAQAAEIRHVLIHGQLGLYIFVRALRIENGEMLSPY